MLRHRTRIGRVRAQLLSFVVLAVLCSPGIVAAQSGEPATYRALVDEAVAEYGASNFEEARSLFTKAVAMYPSARALRGLGMVEFELRNYGDSAANLERALASDVQPLQGELRVEAERLLGRARGFLARVNIAVEPATASLTVDQQPARLGDDRALLLELGDHVLLFRAAGYQSTERVLQVRGGEQLALQIRMRPERPEVAASDETERKLQFEPVSQAPADGEPRRPLYKNPWLWTGVGMVIAGAALGLGFGLRDRGGDGAGGPYRDSAFISGP